MSANERLHDCPQSRVCVSEFYTIYFGNSHDVITKGMLSERIQGVLNEMMD